jgi:hypothetical protein
MPPTDTYRAEIESLHAFFVDWFTGQIARDSYDRVEGALGPEFEMVTPSGTRREYADVVDSIRESYGDREPDTFDIEIRNVERRYTVDDHALLRYEEWQTTPTETTGRLSTVLFETAPDTPEGLVWLDVHETWLDGPSSDGT